MGGMATTRAIRLTTKIPGPRSREIVERKERVIAKPMSLYLPIVAAEGHGSTLTDVDGNSYLDFTGGVGCLNVGHSHPKVVEAVQEQAARFLHTDFTIIPYEVCVTLAERLLAVAPFSGPAKAAFFNAGTEAVENAVKFARSYTRRPAVIGFEGAFHGRTLLSLTLTSKTHPYKAGLGPFAPEVYRVPFPNAYRGITSADALAALERAFITQVAAETVAAIVLEPVQGEGGFIVAPQEFVTGVRAICDRHGIVLVVDEVQTGFGRTGTHFWGFETQGVIPDIVTMAKGIGNGAPLAAVVTTPKIAAMLAQKTHFNTFGGNPVVCAIGKAVLEVIERENLQANALKLGHYIIAGLEKLKAKYPVIGDVRGKGLMLGIEFVKDRATKEPAKEACAQVVENARELGLLLGKGGLWGQTIRFAPPMNITQADADFLLAVLDESLAAL